MTSHHRPADESNDSQAELALSLRLAALHEAVIADGPADAGDGEASSLGPKPSTIGHVLQEGSVTLETLHCLRLIERVRRHENLDASRIGTSALGTREVSDSGPNFADGAAGDEQRMIGRFRILRRLGSGGSGTVFLAIDPELNREVALKVPTPVVLIDDSLRQRFIREAEAAAGLEHPHIVSVYEAGAVGSLCYIATQYCAGDTLAEWLKQHPRMQPRDAATLIQVLALAVHHAHMRGVLHRDIKPGNILLDQPAQNAATPLEGGQLASAARLADFGLAKQLHCDRGDTATYAIVGTPSYMSPEQAEGRTKEIGVPADIFSLGVVLYELLDGRPPFARQSDMATLHALRHEEPRVFRSSEQAPADLAAICYKCLEKNPQQRFGSALELADELDRFLLGEPILTRHIGSLERVHRWCRRNPVLAGASTIAIMSLLLLAIGSSIAALYLIQARQTTLAALDRERVSRGTAQQSERAALESLFEAKLSDARSMMRSGRVGQVIEARESLKEAAALASRLQVSDAKKLAVRNLALEALSGVDLAPHELSSNSESSSHQTATSRDMRLVAITAIGSRELEIRDSDGEDLLETLKVQGEGLAVASTPRFSPDARFVAVRCRRANQGEELQVWRVDQSDPVFVARCAGHGDAVPFAFGEAGDWLAFVAELNLLQIISLETRKPLFELPQASRVYTMAFDPTSSRLALYRDGSVDIIDLPSIQVADRIAAIDPVLSLDWSADGRLLAMGTAGRAIEVWDTMRRRPHTRYVGHGAPVVELDFHPNGQYLASSGHDMTTRLWDLNSGREVLRTAGLVTHFSHDGNWLMHRAGRWHVHLPTGVRVIRIPVQERRELRRITNIAFHPGGRWMILTNGAQLTVWDRKDHRPLHQELLPAEVVEFSQDGKYLSVAGSQFGVVRWRVHDEIRGDLGVVTFQDPEVVRVSPRSEWSRSRKQRTFSVGRPDKMMVLVDADAGTMFAAQISVERGYAGTVSRNGQRLAVAPWRGGSINIFDVESGEMLRAIPSGTAEVAFSPDGRLLAIGESERFRLLDAQTGTELFSTGDRAQGEVPGPVAFSPHGDLLAHLGPNRVTVCVRDAKDFHEIAMFKLPDGQVTLQLAFSPDSRHLFAATSTENQVYDIELARLESELVSLQIDVGSLPSNHSAQTTSLADSPWTVSFQKVPDLRDWRTVITEGVGAIGRQLAGVRQSPTEKGRRPPWQDELDRYAEKLRRVPNDSDTWWRRGNLYRSLGRTDEALADFQRAIAIQPSSHHAYYWRGLTYMEAYRYPEAIRDFERSLQIHSADHWPCRHLAWMYIAGPVELRNLDRGMQLARRAVELNGNHVTHHETLAWAFVRTGDTVSALKALDAASKIAPPSTCAELVHAICAYRLGQRAQAEKHWESAIGQLDTSRTLPREALQDLCDEVASLLKQ